MAGDPLEGCRDYGILYLYLLPNDARFFLLTPNDAPVRVHLAMGLGRTIFDAKELVDRSLE